MIARMLRVEEAQALVLAEIARGAAEDVALDESLHRVLREEIVAASA
jgi:molybdopterin biosynthesis enzyme